MVGLIAIGDLIEEAQDSSFATSGWAVQEHTLGRHDADPQEELGIHERKLDDLPKLPNLLFLPRFSNTRLTSSS